MSIVKMSLECGCFLKSNFENNKSYDSRDEALMKANKMADTMNNVFCQKHFFKVLEDGDDFLIEVKKRD